MYVCICMYVHVSTPQLNLTRAYINTGRILLHCDDKHIYTT